MKREEVMQVLQDDVTSAKQQLDDANRSFDDVIREVPSMLPHPDGVQRIKSVSRDLALSRDKLNEAVERLNNFMLHGTIPHDLQKKPSKKQDGDDSQKHTSTGQTGNA